MQNVPTDMKSRAPSSRVLQEVIRQAPAEYVTIGWLTSTLHRHSFGIIMLSLGLLATTPVGSSIPGLILAVMAVQLILGRTDPVFPHFIMTRRLPTRQLLRLGGHAIHVLKYLEKFVHPRWPMTFEVGKVMTAPAEHDQSPQCARRARQDQAPPLAMMWNTNPSTVIPTATAAIGSRTSAVAFAPLTGPVQVSNSPTAQSRKLG